MILAGDLGGTKTNLAVFEIQQGKLHLLQRQKFNSHEYPRAEDVVEAFARDSGGKITAACFGVAGPVFDDKVRATNLPWVVDAGMLARMLAIPQVTLLNDMDATFHGIGVLEPAELYPLQTGSAAPRDHQALIAAGTGLGEAIRFWDGDHFVVFPTEGGHADFAARTDVEIELLRFVKTRHQWVDCETIISGRGFREIHEFFDHNLQHPSFTDPHADAAAEITQRALNRTCPVCVKALDLWVDLYGAEAGNLALRSLARGGVYVAGGISAKIFAKLKDGRFAVSFAQKAKFENFLSQIPITLILNEDAPLLGAASVAAGAALAEAGQEDAVAGSP